MNRSLVAAVGTLCAVGITLGAASTALAGTGSAGQHARASIAAQASMKPTVLVGKASSIGTKQTGSVTEQSSVRGTEHGQAASSEEASHAAAMEQLQSATSALKTAIKADQSAHQQLVQAMQNFRQALQQAMANGDSTSVQAALQAAQNVRSTIQQAISDQHSAGATQKVSIEGQQDGQLSNAVNAIKTVVTRDNQAAAAMLRAAQGLNNQTATLKGSTQSPSLAASATSTTTASTSSDEASGIVHDDASLIGELGDMSNNEVHGTMEGALHVMTGLHRK